MNSCGAASARTRIPRWFFLLHRLPAVRQTDFDPQIGSALQRGSPEAQWPAREAEAGRGRGCGATG
jgi:hypothetical protein